MIRARIKTPSRLHFGLLARGADAPRQFGGVGLMVDAPGLELVAEPSPTWRAEGPCSARILQVAERAARLDPTLSPAFFRVLHAPLEHVGLGSGTQLALAVAKALTTLVGRPAVPIAELARLAGRGLRSGIGLHGFASGGLIVDGGRGRPEGIPPQLARLDLPAAWSVLVVIPPLAAGLHGSAELRAFAELPPIPAAQTDQLCRLVLLGLLPAAAEADLPGFGAALEAIQHLIGRSFAPAQSGPFAHPQLAELAARLRSEGLHGVGQSSWGPALYAFAEDPDDELKAWIAGDLQSRFAIDPVAVIWTTANRRGAEVKTDESAWSRKIAP